jgi:hypothetical protein
MSNKNKPLGFLIVSCAISIIIGLALSVAIKSGYNASPDEHDHFLAAEYFKLNSFTPVERSNDAVYTYNSLWSYSRVYSKGFDYFISWKIF